MDKVFADFNEDVKVTRRYYNEVTYECKFLATSRIQNYFIASAMLQILNS